MGVVGNLVVQSFESLDGDFASVFILIHVSSLMLT